MFRLSRFLQLVAAPDTPYRAPTPRGPVVIWNLTRRCNLTCEHCYAVASDRHFPGELDREQLFAALADMHAAKVPAVILSGGEPLLHPHVHALAAQARNYGMYTALSSNGTMIDADTVRTLRATGYDYVGISLDGVGATHDRFRRRRGAYQTSLAAIRRCVAAGLSTGIRFTLTQANRHDLVPLLALMRVEGVDKFYLSHLNYGGRGNVNRASDAHFQTTRAALNILFEVAWQDIQADAKRTYVTGNNDADAAYLLRWTERHFPERTSRLREALNAWGGNASGVAVANVDNVGNVHPDTFWWHKTLGNVKERAFGAIWEDVSDPLMAGLKRRPRPVKGRCARCQYVAMCGGNTRVRAEQITGDPWAEDPGCYLSDEEIGVASGDDRVTVAPFSARHSVTDRAWANTLRIGGGP